MTNCPITTLVAAEGVSDVSFGIIGVDSTMEECCIQLDGGQGPADLVVYSVTGDLTITLLGGDGPSASGDRVFKVRAGSGVIIPLPIGEVLRADGSVHFVAQAETQFSHFLPMMIVIRRVNTVTH